MTPCKRHLTRCYNENKVPDESMVAVESMNGQPGSVNSIETAELIRPLNFFEHIGRKEVGEILTPKTPWAYITMEYFGDGIQGQGGLGMLASDTADVAAADGIPAVFLTPFYPEEVRQTMDGFQQKIEGFKVDPEDRGFQRTGDVTINTKVKKEDKLVEVVTQLGVYVKQKGTVTIVTVSEPNFGRLYKDNNNSDHRLYQEVALGFGGTQALRLLDVNPNMNQQLNEAPTVFAALARLDQRLEETGDFEQALQAVRDTSIYTNHTLVQAVEASFTMDQFERFVMPNLKNKQVRDWLNEKIQGKGGRIQLSTLAIELSGKKNGVSEIHAREAGKTYYDYNGNPVEFKAVTNGISLERWGDPALLDLYRRAGILDEYDMPTKGYVDKLKALDPAQLETIKTAGRARMREKLKTRKDQYGNSIDIPDSARVATWTRRFAGYKRPGMMFEDQDRLADILKKNDMHIVMAGKAHPNDEAMVNELKRILELVDRNPVLKQRVHFVQNYDESLARALVQGADVAVNTPEVRDERTGNRISTEACGTSWEKYIFNNTILISTDDGGVADLSVAAEAAGTLESYKPPYLQIAGNSQEEELESLYQQMEKGGELSAPGNEQAKFEFLENQAASYLKPISGSRMEEDYINFAFARQKLQQQPLAQAA